MSPDEIIGHILAGHKILIRAYDSLSRNIEMHEIAKKRWPNDISISWNGFILRSKATGGLAHYVINDDEVMGREYHVGSGPLTKNMASCIRLES